MNGFPVLLHLFLHTIVGSQQTKKQLFHNKNAIQYLRRGNEGDRRRLGGGAGEGERRRLAGGGDGLLLLLLRR